MSIIKHVFSVDGDDFLQSCPRVSINLTETRKWIWFAVIQVWANESVLDTHSLNNSCPYSIAESHDQQGDSSLLRHDDVNKWKPFPRYWPLCGEFTGDRWIPLTKASDADLLFANVLECYELTGVSLLWTRRALANKAKIGKNVWQKLGFIKEFTLIVF